MGNVCGKSKGTGKQPTGKSSNAVETAQKGSPREIPYRDTRAASPQDSIPQKQQQQQKQKAKKGNEDDHMTKTRPGISQSNATLINSMDERPHHLKNEGPPAEGMPASRSAYVKAPRRESSDLEPESTEDIADRAREARSYSTHAKVLQPEPPDKTKKQPTLPISPARQSSPQAGVLNAKRRADGAKVKDVYQLGKTLGVGGYAVVKRAVHRNTGVAYACKIMGLPPTEDGSAPNEGLRGEMFAEIDILCRLDHPNIVSLVEFFEEGSKVYIITELLTGGELLAGVMKHGNYSEVDARRFARQLLDALAYLHAAGVVHRDLKLENLVLARPMEESTGSAGACVKIVDFGLAKRVREARLGTACGTPQYMAPECFAPGIQGSDPKAAHGLGVDAWSAGVLLFILLAGYPPFHDAAPRRLVGKIKRGAYDFDDPVWDSISEGAQNLIRGLLTVNPHARLTAQAARAHPWLQEEEDVVEAKDLRQTMTNLQINTPRLKFKACVEGIIAVNRLTSPRDAKGDRISSHDANKRSERNSFASVESAGESMS